MKQPAASQAAARKYPPEVQGLRALAVLMVVAYHVWFGRISGGVDIFLLISAFLLTGQFTRKLEAGRPLDLLKYWVHLFKRLLPLIAVTLWPPWGHSAIPARGTVGRNIWRNLGFLVLLPELVPGFRVRELLCG